MHYMPSFNLGQCVPCDIDYYSIRLFTVYFRLDCLYVNAKGRQQFFFLFIIIILIHVKYYHTFCNRNTRRRIDKSTKSFIPFETPKVVVLSLLPISFRLVSWLFQRNVFIYIISIYPHIHTIYIQIVHTHSSYNMYLYTQFAYKCVLTSLRSTQYN